eukprot:scaffold34379_cov54-Phaeocystis_antarctica.AAC.2
MLAQAARSLRFNDVVNVRVDDRVSLNGGDESRMAWHNHGHNTKGPEVRCSGRGPHSSLGRDMSVAARMALTAIATWSDIFCTLSFSAESWATCSASASRSRLSDSR